MFVLYLVDLASVCDLHQSCSIFLYADDILLIAPTVSKLEALLHICERELQWLDMNITRMHGSALRCVRSHSRSVWNMANLTPL